jgi:hypothetical protein
MADLATITSAVGASVHAGSPLPAARVVVVGVPAAALLLYWWVSRRRSGR